MSRAVVPRDVGGLEQPNDHGRRRRGSSPAKRPALRSRLGQVATARLANRASQALREALGARETSLEAMTTLRTGNTWIVVADGRRGRLFELPPHSKNIRPATDHELVATLVPSRERWADRAGQTLERSGRSRHAKAAPSDPKDQDKMRLARRIAEEVDRARNEDVFEHLVLVAPPAFLGKLRAVLGEPARRSIIGEHDKDLSRLAEHDLRSRLAEMILS